MELDGGGVVGGVAYRQEEPLTYIDKVEDVLGCVSVRTGTGKDTPHMFVKGGNHRRGATRYTGTK